MGDQTTGTTPEELQKTIRTARNLANEELQATIRDGRAVLKDFRQAIREAEELTLKLAANEVQTRIEAEVKKGLDEYMETVSKAMDEAVEKVAKEFERLEQLFLGTDRASKRAGKPTIEDLIARPPVSDN